jgi:predicted RNase H-like HicB family nuclease
MKKRDRYLYPAVFAYEDGYEIAVTFPDLPGCATSGTDDSEALAMAKEALGGHLWCLEEDGDEIPHPTRLCDVALEDNERVALVDVYMPSIRLSQRNRSVNTTVILPAWLNSIAHERGIDFSLALQNALINEFGING